jgi:hypothetical protein
MTSRSDLWDEDAAARHAERAGEKRAPAVLGPTVDCLARLAGTGPVREFAVGTGRVAIPLVGRGRCVTGIDLSQPMLDALPRDISPRGRASRSLRTDLALTKLGAVRSLPHRPARPAEH